MILGLVGFAGSGKGTIGDLLVKNHGYKTESFAKSVKDAAAVIFGCQDRLCTYNKNDQTINLISNTSAKDAKSATWITINKVKFALVASAGKLALFRKP